MPAQNPKLIMQPDLASLYPVQLWRYRYFHEQPRRDKAAIEFLLGAQGEKLVKFFSGAPWTGHVSQSAAVRPSAGAARPSAAARQPSPFPRNLYI